MDENGETEGVNKKKDRSREEEKREDRGGNAYMKTRGVKKRKLKRVKRG